MRLSRATKSGFAYLLSYAWSKSIDLACSGDYGVEGCEVRNVYNLAPDRSVSGFDLTHSFVGSVHYELPFGRKNPVKFWNRIVRLLDRNWEFNGIVSLHSGLPYDVTYQGDLANTGNTFVRVATHENVSNRTRRSFLAARAVGGAFLLLLPAAASYAQTVRTADAQAFVSSPLPEKQSAETQDDSIRTFHINVPDEQLVDLRRRLAATRWPDKETVNDKSQGGWRRGSESSSDTLVANHLLGLRFPLQLAADPVRHIAEVARSRAAVAGLNIGDRLLPRLDAMQEISHMREVLL